MSRNRGEFRTNRLAGYLLILLLAPMLTACSGGGDDDGPPPVACLDLDFIKAIGTVNAGSVYLRRSNNLSCSIVEVEVAISNLSSIFTVGFDLTYPGAVVEYDSAILGPLLQKDTPTNPPFMIVTPGAGNVMVSVTRLAPDPSIGAVGSEVLLTLKFRKVATGTGVIDFDSSGSSAVNEIVQDENGVTRPATFGPDHGGMVVVP